MCRPIQADREKQRRHGTANLFIAFEPLAGRRVMEMTVRRAAGDFAQFANHPLDAVYPSAATGLPVTDNLNTHCTGS